MKALRILLSFILATLVCALLSIDDVDGAEMPAPTEGYGSCYEVQPICIQGRPACMCDITNRCFWACR